MAAYVDGDAIVGLSARRAGLEALPASVIEFADLEALDLDGNPLARLPEGLGQLQALRALSAYGTALASVPVAVTTWYIPGCPGARPSRIVGSGRKTTS